MVKNMSFDDMTREKKLKRIEIAESALAAGLAAGVMTMSMSVLAPTTAIGAAMAKNSTPIILATTSASRPGSMGSYKDKVQKDRLKRWNERYNT